MIVVLAIDGLEYERIKEFECRNLMQESFGKTDISEFSQPRTIVLWSSFMTGQNKEKEILAKGNKEMWNTEWDLKDTFFSSFKKPIVLDLPGYSYDADVHDKSRLLLKKFFEAEYQEVKDRIREEYNKDAFEHHRRIKEEFFKALSDDYDFVLGYFSLADVVGHLNFGNALLMKMIYKEFDEIAARVRKKGFKLVVLSDHGMKSVGMFGDHSDYGFWSVNFDNELNRPRITEFNKILNKI